MLSCSFSHPIHDFSLVSKSARHFALHSRCSHLKNTDLQHTLICLLRPFTAHSMLGNGSRAARRRSRKNTSRYLSRSFGFCCRRFCSQGEIIYEQLFSLSALLPPHPPRHPRKARVERSGEKALTKCKSNFRRM
jgi:hypothetical protein